MAALKNYSDAEGIPYHYWLADSWWYPKDYAGGNGVLTWTAVPEVFPHGSPASRGDGVGRVGLQPVLERKNSVRAQTVATLTSR